MCDNQKGLVLRAKAVFDEEISELTKARDALDEQSVGTIINLLKDCQGKVVLCGMGKPGHIGRKISATMCSLGIESYFLHPAEAAHGDLGTLSEKDVVIMISNSGESDEIIRLIPNIKMIGTPIVAITSNASSSLAMLSDYQIILPTIKEAGELKLAPTSSTTIELVLGDSLAIVVSELKQMGEEHYALCHPAGTLGKKLTVRVNDLMHVRDANLVVQQQEKVIDAISRMVESRQGAIAVVDSGNVIMGIITEGDLKRYITKGIDLYSTVVDNVMTKKAVCVMENTLAVDALKLMQKRDKILSVLPVINSSGEFLGMIRNNDIISAGIFI